MNVSILKALFADADAYRIVTASQAQSGMGTLPASAVAFAEA
jgi:hypothetical protein